MQNCACAGATHARQKKHRTPEKLKMEARVITNHKKEAVVWLIIMRMATRVVTKHASHHLWSILVDRPCDALGLSNFEKLISRTPM